MSYTNYMIASTIRKHMSLKYPISQFEIFLQNTFQ